MSPSSKAPQCPVKRVMQSAFFRFFYVHVFLFLSFVGLVSASAQNRTDGGISSCPFLRSSKYLTAFSFASNVSGQKSRRSAKSIDKLKSSSHTHYISISNKKSETTRALRRRRPLWMSAVQEIPVDSIPDSADSKAEKKRRIENSVNPLQVHVVGLSHHNAAVNVREKLAVPEAEWNKESMLLCENENIAEAAVLSTCNRFEVYIASHNARRAIRETISHLQKRSGLSQSVLRESLFILSAEDAVWHILRVSAGLDSLVVGEGQILSQVRQCYLHGTEEDGSAGKVIARLFNTAVSAGKRVRSETSISKGAVSISSAAAEFSKYRCEPDLRKPFESARLTIVGAGTMSRLLLIHLQSLGIKKVTLINRSMPKCLELQSEFSDIEFDIKLSDELESSMLESDIVFTSTSATNCIFTQDRLELLNAGKSHSIMFVDISVPRNVEAECNEVEGIFAYDVDDLKMVVARNTASRRREIIEAESILHDEMMKFQGWQQSLSAIPAISKMQEKFESMRAEEVRKVANKLSKLTTKEMEVVEKLSRGIVNKMLHGPMSALRQPEGPEQKKRTLNILKEMFKLEKELL